MENIKFKEKKSIYDIKAAKISEAIYRVTEEIQTSIKECKGSFVADLLAFFGISLVSLLIARCVVSACEMTEIFRIISTYIVFEGIAILIMVFLLCIYYFSYLYNKKTLNRLKLLRDNLYELNLDNSIDEVKYAMTKEDPFGLLSSICKVLDNMKTFETLKNADIHEIQVYDNNCINFRCIDDEGCIYEIALNADVKESIKLENEYILRLEENGAITLIRPLADAEQKEKLKGA